jgi:hypothetical protein
MKLFNKISGDVTKLFNKVNSSAPTLMRKFNNTIRKADNTVGRVGNFISNTSNQLGGPAIIGDTAKYVAGRVHDGRKQIMHTENIIKNNLEKAIHAPMKEINDPHSVGGQQPNMSFT